MRFVVIYEDWESSGRDDEHLVDRVQYFNSEEEVYHSIQCGNIPDDAGIFCIIRAEELDRKLKLYWINYWKEIAEKPLPNTEELLKMTNVSCDRFD